MSVRAIIAKELHKQKRRNFKRRYVELKGINDLYQADLVEVIPLARLNNGYRYIMTMINCFTKYAYAVPLKSKTGNEIVKALVPILKTIRFKHFQTDQGTEWLNTLVQMLFKKYNVNHYFTYSDKKASIVERFNRTLKNMMWIMFTEQGTYEWWKNLTDLVNSYNNNVHRTIGMRPIDVTRNNERQVLEKIYADRKKKYPPVSKPKFKLHEAVRISKYKGTFAKGYEQNFSNEIFTIAEIKNTNPLTYIIKDHKGELIKGAFYEQEMTKVKHPDIYLVEKIIRTKGDKVLVRWLGFDKSHDSWISRTSII